MSTIQVYHNPHFLDYHGDHNQIVHPRQPTASLQLPEEMAFQEKLQVAYARTQHGNLYPSWFHDPEVIPHLRSTSVGDLLGTEEGRLYVVESMGFKPYQPATTNPIHQLREAARQLAAAVAKGDPVELEQTARKSLTAIQQTLATEAYPANEMPVAWGKAQVGDLIGSSPLGYFRIIARKLRPKWRAIHLVAHIPNSNIWLDEPGTWAVIVPVSKPDLSARWT